MKILTFWGYYNELKNEKAEFIKKISVATGKSQRTVYNWLNGTHPVSPDDQIKICAALNIPANENPFFFNQVHVKC